MSMNNGSGPTSPTILMLGTADWDQAIATNQHYMARELSSENHLCFVESIGLRRPEFALRDLKRIGRRIVGKTNRHISRREQYNDMSVISPRIIPIHKAPWNVLNGPLLESQTRTWGSAREPKILWTYSPVTYGCENQAKHVVYHCVDMLGDFPGIDAGVIDRAERRLALAGATAIGSSLKVVEHLKAQGYRKVLYWPNVADIDVFLHTPTSPVAREGVVFAGNLSEHKIDFDLFHDVLKSGLQLHLAGPIAEGGGNSAQKIGELEAKGAKYHGLLNLHDLAKLFVRCKVGVIPYKLTPYTEGVSPLKTFEYLSAGLPVVSTDLPGVESTPPGVFVESSSSRFMERLKSLHGERTNEDLNRALSMNHSWTSRGQAARNLVQALVNDDPVSE